MVHVAAVLDAIGRLLDTESFPAATDENRDPFDWAWRFGAIDVAGIDGTGSWGAAVARCVRARGVTCVEVSSPNRQHHRRYGKSDTAVSRNRDEAGLVAAISGVAAVTTTSLTESPIGWVLRPGYRPALRQVLSPQTYPRHSAAAAGYPSPVPERAPVCDLNNWNADRFHKVIPWASRNLVGLAYTPNYAS